MRMSSLLTTFGQLITARIVSSKNTLSGLLAIIQLLNPV